MSIEPLETKWRLRPSDSPADSPRSTEETERPDEIQAGLIDRGDSGAEAIHLQHAGGAGEWGGDRVRRD
ncbi:hypothetical protein NDU88_004540 [Pleurodeles waltl]|uniref:Uncharacterized protein n=1 Tax=Pleurodeles waltl TaxID=8319 RepID=A0AAV7VGI6_PLEWA|nr:hypothetical protein NDU88_004540 [Pleurodeles waltl]